MNYAIITFSSKSLNSCFQSIKIIMFQFLIIMFYKAVLDTLMHKYNPTSLHEHSGRKALVPHENIFPPWLTSTLM